MQLKHANFKMKFELTEQKENALFNRKEIKGIAESEVTPSREIVLKLLSEKLSVPEENIKIKGIRGKYGSKIFNIEANIYSSKEEKESIELKKKKEAEAEKKTTEAELKPETNSAEQTEKPEEVKSDQPEQEKSEEKIEEGKDKEEEEEKAKPEQEQ